jgi:putative ABC transport system ATP-binding protein
MVTLESVCKTFYPGTPKEVRALQNVTVTFKEGDFCVLTGESGSGKTTLLNMIGALDTITSGEIRIDGHEIASLEESELSKVRLEHIGFVFQAYNLVPVLSVKENIGFVMRLRGMDETAIGKRVAELAAILQIGDIIDKMPNELSGGQQQRVAVARAVAPRPKIILADEPTANLDSKNSLYLMQMFKALNERENITVIFASHDDYVVEQARRIIVMEDGKIIDDRTRA